LRIVASLIKRFGSIGDHHVGFAFGNLLEDHRVVREEF